MNRRAKTTMERELRAAGASSDDVQELSRLATSLARLKTPGLAPGFGWRRRLRSRLWLAGSGVVSGLVVGVLLVAVAQTSYPGGLLYPLKRASETVAVAVHPDYRGAQMMRRAEEVRQLATSHRDPALVAATLQDYRTEAVAYQSQTQNYAAFKYCQAYLQQAEGAASGSERQEISNTLATFRPDEGKG